MVVISIIVILLSLTIPNYSSSILHAKETALRDDLYTLRSLIDQYTLDKQKAPQSLQDIVDAGYLKQLPKDPFTNARDTWVPVADESIMSPDQTAPGIIDVHSGSEQNSSEGTAYNTWKMRASPLLSGIRFAMRLEQTCAPKAENLRRLVSSRQGYPGRIPRSPGV